MSQAMAVTNDNGMTAAGRIDRFLITGDVGKMSEDDRRAYYLRTCESLGLNPLTRPFEFLVLNGKTVMYAKKDCTDQLRQSRKISLRIVSRVTEGDVHVVTVQATTPDGRTDESTGAVNIAGLKGENLCNSIMKAETKAKRRVTLSICGLGILDESETDTIPGLRPVVDVETLSALPPVDLSALVDSYIARVDGETDGKKLMAIYVELQQDARIPEASRSLVRAALTEQRKKNEGQ